MTNQQTPESIRHAEQHHLSLLSMPKPPVTLVRSNERWFGRFVRCAVNSVVAILIVLLPLALGYLVYGIDGFNTVFLSVITLVMIVALMGCVTIGITISAFLQWRQRGVNGLAELKCCEALIGPGGIYLAGVHTPLELLTRVYQTTDAADELKFEFREPNGRIITVLVLYPAEQLDIVGQLQLFLNEHDACSLGMAVVELPINATKNATNEMVPIKSSVTYSYKLNASLGRYNLRLEDHSIEVFDEGGTAVREIEFSQIRNLYEYSGIRATDPRSGGYQTEFCQIKAALWKSLKIRNGSHIAPNGKMGEFSTNQRAEFEAFMQELKLRIAVVRPYVAVKTGSTIVVLICSVVVLVGLFFGFVAFGPAENVAVRIVLVGFAALMGGPMVWFGGRAAFGYWPRRRPVSECVPQYADAIREVATS